MQEQTKENKLPVVLLAVIIVVLLVGSIVIGIFGGGGKKVETAVPKKDIKAAREAAELSDEGEVQTIAIDKDIIVNAGGTGSADEKSEMQDSQTTEDSQTVQNTEEQMQRCPEYQKTSSELEEMKFLPDMEDVSTTRHCSSILTARAGITEPLVRTSSMQI